jgi:hypothetical protein
MSIDGGGVPPAELWLPERTRRELNSGAQPPASTEVTPQIYDGSSTEAYPVDQTVSSGGDGQDPTRPQLMPETMPDPGAADYSCPPETDGAVEAAVPVTEAPEAAAEQAPDESYVRIKGMHLLDMEEVQGADQLLNHPMEGKVTNALNEGKTLEFVIRGADDGAHFYATPEIVSDYAITEEVPADGQASDEKPNLPYWVGLTPVKHNEKVAASAEGDGPTPTGTVDGLTLENISLVTGDYEVKIRFVPVPEEQHGELEFRLERGLSDLRNLPSRRTDAVAYEGALTAVVNGAESAVARVSVEVGASTPEKLREVVDVLAGEVLPSEGTTWRRLRDPDNPRRPLPPSDDRQIVRDRLGREITALETASIIAKTVTLPVHELAGGYRTERIDAGLGMTRELPAGEPRIHLGRIIDVKTRKLAGEFATVPSLDNAGTFYFGASGRGKSTLLEQHASETMRVNDGNAIIFVVDPQSGDNLTQKIVNRTNSIGIEAEGRLIRPGEGEYNYTLDMLDPTLNSPREAVEKLVQGIMVSMGKLDAESARPLERYMTEGGLDAFRSKGWDVKLGASEYPNGQPDWPDFDDIMSGIARAVNEGYSKRVGPDIATFASGTVEKVAESHLGDLLNPQYGQRLQMEKMLLKPGMVHGFGLEHLGDQAAKTVATWALLTSTIDAVKALDKRGIKHPDLTFMIDECHIFPDSPAGEKTAHLATVWRRYLKFVGAKQYGLDRDHPAAFANILTIGSFFVKSPTDSKIIAEAMGRERMPILTSGVMRPGTLAIKGPDMDKPVLVQVPRLSAVPDVGRVSEPTDFVDTSKYGRLVSKRELVTAEVAYKRHIDFAVLKAVTELNSFFSMRGRFADERGYGPAIAFAPEYRAHLGAFKGELPAIKDIAVRNYAHDSVTTRPAWGYGPEKEKVIAYLLRHTLPQIAGGLPPAELRPPVDLALPTERLGIIKRRLEIGMTASSHPDSAQWAQALGAPEVKGRTASEQVTSINFLNTLVKDSLKKYVQAIAKREAVSGAAPTSPTLRPIGLVKDYLEGGKPLVSPTQPSRLHVRAQEEQAKLITGADDRRQTAADIQREIADELEKEGVTVNYWPAPATTPSGMGIPGIKKELEAYIAKVKAEAPRPPQLRSLERALGVEIKGDTAEQAFDDTLKLEAAERVEQTRRVIGPKVNAIDQLFAPDSQGKTVLDNTMMAIIGLSDETGAIQKEMEALLREGRSVTDSLVDRIAYEQNGYALSEKWIDTFRTHIVYNRNLVMAEADRLWLLDNFQSFVGGLRKRANEIKAMKPAVPGAQ